MRTRTVVAAAGAFVTLALTPVAWASRGSGGASVAATPDGAELFVAKGCSSCHLGPDTRPRFESAPSLFAAPQWAGSRREGMTAEEYVKESIRTPSVFISPAAESGGPAGPMMPTLTLTDDEIEALADYVLQR